jgi:hypothetical protein
VPLPHVGPGSDVDVLSVVALVASELAPLGSVESDALMDAEALELLELARESDVSSTSTDGPGDWHAAAIMSATLTTSSAARRPYAGGQSD